MSEKLAGGLAEGASLTRSLASQTENDAEFQAVLGDTLNNLCALVAHATGAQASVVAQQDITSDTIKVLGKVGTLVRQVDKSFVLPELSYEKMPFIFVSDIRNDVRFFNHPLLRLMPHMKSLAAMLIPVPPFAGRAVLKLINPRKSAMQDGTVMQVLADACATAAGVLSMASTAKIAVDARDKPPAQEVQAAAIGVPLPIASPPEQPEANKDAAAQFLRETLVRKRTLHARNGVDFVTLRTWRLAIKKYQIAALTAVKARPPPEFVESVAQEIAESVRQTHGEGAINSVVPIPPGSSGHTKAFASQVASRVAELIGAIYCDVLESRAAVRPGRSSPHKSAALQPYKPVTGLNCPILIVDDVASSGRHLELALKAVKTAHCSAYAVAWIGKS